MIIRLYCILLCLAIFSGCATSTRQLSNEEFNALKKLKTRLQDNRDTVHGSFDDLSRISNEVSTDLNSLELSISKAKLLESMKSPWTNPHPDMAATQKEVAFYHLYSLSEAQNELYEARLKERRQHIKEVKKAYDNMVTVTDKIIEAEKIILAHLNQPASARISAFIANVMVETKAFRKTLSESDNPKLKELAKDVAKAEGKMEKVKERIDKALENKVLNELLKRKES